MPERRNSLQNIGKKKSRHLIEISELQVLGNPGRDCSGIVLKLWRHDKQFQTKEESVTPDQTPACRWAEKVCFAATLYESKGRFSKKIYQVSMLARFGGTKLYEVASAQLDLANIAPAGRAGVAQELKLKPKSGRRGSVGMDASVAELAVGFRIAAFMTGAAPAAVDAGGAQADAQPTLAGASPHASVLTHEALEADARSEDSGSDDSGTMTTLSSIDVTMREQA